MNATAGSATNADEVVRALGTAGVDVLFGFPGETSLPLYLAAQRQSVVRHVLARCPRCAGYMAEAYARITHRPAACDAPGGVGSPHTAPALLEAHNSATPLVFLASGAARRTRGRWTTGECDQQQMFAPVTKQRMRLEVADGLCDRVRAATQHARAPRSGPVFVEIPADLLSAPAPGTPGKPYLPEPPLRACPRRDAVDDVARRVRGARQAVVVAGGGVHLGDATGPLRRLIAATGLPVATTLNGKGAVDERLPHALGVTGAKGSAAANAFVATADCIIAIGTKLGDKSTDGFRWPHPGQTLIHVDADATELTRFGHAGVPVLGDAGDFCRALTAALRDFRYAGADFEPEQPAWDGGLTQLLCERLTDHLADRDVVVADASVASGWAGAALRMRGADQRLITPRGSGSLGYALPAAIGAQFARPDGRIFAIGGDGGFAMAMHEMETAARLNLPITYFLLNNQRLGLIERHAVGLLGGRGVSDGFTAIDWPAIATAFGWRSFRVRDRDDLATRWKEICDGWAPTLVECVVPADEVAPDHTVTPKGEVP
ncbi:thiamine pyrophosphate-binding protein [Mangrovihabitans endophyticus]|uniref:Acetolactate synthase large subunit n=1 Tax=Mangrovihabitans endophyticus TaxID=1751298 RepID=A0A8J3BT65_9ACTN|nr:thiamine pyrophosphate-binding protein [Mangrovihabitans endophyticus]GGK75282.1 acetolactate synthase large subunit [Mangrovihabitans endophyticus]